MSKITRERAAQIAAGGGYNFDEVEELARIALASLEAEPVGEVSEQRDGLVMDGTVDLGGASTHRIIKGASKMKRLPLGTKFYTAPPAPVSVADESAVELLVTDLMERIDKITGERHSVATLSSLRTSIVKACRAAMVDAGQ